MDRPAGARSGGKRRDRRTLDPGLRWDRFARDDALISAGWKERSLRNAWIDRTAPGVSRLRMRGGHLAAGSCQAWRLRIRGHRPRSPALERARECARKWRVDTDRLPEALPDGRYDLIVSNILARPLVDLAPLFATCMDSGARIALSGVLAEQATQVAAAYASEFDLRVEAVSEGWALLAGERR